VPGGKMREASKGKPKQSTAAYAQSDGLPTCSACQCGLQSSRQLARWRRQLRKHCRNQLGGSHWPAGRCESGRSRHVITSFLHGQTIRANHTADTAHNIICSCCMAQITRAQSLPRCPPPALPVSGPQQSCWSGTAACRCQHHGCPHQQRLQGIGYRSEHPDDEATVPVNVAAIMVQLRLL
jgi:hypothetical protein